MRIIHSILSIGAAMGSVIGLYAMIKLNSRRKENLELWGKIEELEKSALPGSVTVKLINNSEEETLRVDFSKDLKEKFIFHPEVQTKIFDILANPSISDYDKLLEKMSTNKLDPTPLMKKLIEDPLDKSALFEVLNRIHVEDPLFFLGLIARGELGKSLPPHKGH